MAVESTREQPEDGGTARHVPALDGIRGFAILLVLVYHLVEGNNDSSSRVLRWLRVVHDSCWVGVDLFYVLSGFLITGILYDSLQDTGYFRNFFVRRTLRIFPLYYGVLLVLLALSKPLHLVWHGSQWVLLLYLQNTGIGVPLFSIIPGPGIDLTAFWSLAVEEHFYLVWPFLVYWIKDLHRLLWASLGLAVGSLLLRGALLAHGVDPRFLYCFTACRADALLLGGSLALALRSRWRNRVLAQANRLFWGPMAVLVVTAIAQQGLNWSKGWFVPTLGFTLTALAGVGLIAATFKEGFPARSGHNESNIQKSWPRAFFSVSVLRLFGKYSYGIYIYHGFVDAVLNLRVRHALQALTGSRAVGLLGSVLAVVLLTLGVAWLSYNLYEKQFLKLKNRFTYGRGTRREGAFAGVGASLNGERPGGRREKGRSKAR